jgi:hypothetical protein
MSGNTLNEIDMLSTMKIRMKLSLLMGLVYFLWVASLPFWSSVHAFRQRMWIIGIGNWPAEIVHAGFIDWSG